VIGLAASKEEALQIVQQIVEDTYAKQNDVDVRRYLGERLLEDEKQTENNQ